MFQLCLPLPVRLVTRLQLEFKIVWWAQFSAFFDEESRLLPNTEILDKKLKILVKNPTFGEKSKFSSKIQIFVKNPNFRQKFKFSSKIQILVKHTNFRQKSKSWSKI